MHSDALTILCGHRFQPMPRRSRAEIDTPPVRLVAPPASSASGVRSRSTSAPISCAGKSRWWGRGRSRNKARPSAPSSSPSGRWTWSGSSRIAGGSSRPRKPTGSSTRRRPARPSSCRPDVGERSPLYPQKRANSRHLEMSALCQSRTNAPQQKPMLGPQSCQELLAQAPGGLLIDLRPSTVRLLCAVFEHGHNL